MFMTVKYDVGSADNWRKKKIYIYQGTEERRKSFKKCPTALKKLINSLRSSLIRSVFYQNVFPFVVYIHIGWAFSSTTDYRCRFWLSSFYTKKVCVFLVGIWIIKGCLNHRGLKMTRYVHDTVRNAWDIVGRCEGNYIGHTMHERRNRKVSWLKAFVGSLRKIESFCVDNFIVWVIFSNEIVMKERLLMKTLETRDIN